MKKGGRGWKNFTLQILSEVGLDVAWVSQSVVDEVVVGESTWVSVVKSHLQIAEQTQWRLAMLSNCKLDGYRLWKVDLKYENYLDLDGWVNLVRIRGGTNCLRLEMGRFEVVNGSKGLLRKWRLCELCFCEVEDAEHVLLRCRAFVSERSDLLNALMEIDPIAVAVWLREGDDASFLGVLMTDGANAAVASFLGVFLKKRRLLLRKK